jgi:hypothetical protein
MSSPELFVFTRHSTIEEVRFSTELYRDNTDQQDIFMGCLRDAYNMGYLEWKNNGMRIALESLLNRHIIYCGGEPDLPFAGHTDIELFNLCKAVLGESK